jgi:hypothetical protein
MNSNFYVDPITGERRYNTLQRYADGGAVGFMPNQQAMGGANSSFRKLTPEQASAAYGEFVRTGDDPYGLALDMMSGGTEASSLVNADLNQLVNKNKQLRAADPIGYDVGNIVSNIVHKDFNKSQGMSPSSLPAYQQLQSYQKGMGLTDQQMIDAMSKSPLRSGSTYQQNLNLLLGPYGYAADGGETGAVPAGVPTVPTSTAAGMLNALPGGQAPAAQGSFALSAAPASLAMPTNSAGAVLSYEHPYINPITGERKTVTGGSTGQGAPAGFIDALNPNIYGGQQSDLAVGLGFFAKGDTVNLSPLLNNMTPGQGPVRVDQNIGNVQLPGKSTDYTYEQAGNSIRVKDKSGNVVSQIFVQADVNGTQLRFADGTVGAIGVKKDGSWEIQLNGKPAGVYTGIPTVTGGTGNDTVTPLPSPTLPPYKEGVADPTIPMPPIDARPVTPVTVPPINQEFLDSPVRQWDPLTQSFKYGSPTSLSPATGPGGAGGSGAASWTPPGVTLRRPSLLQVATSDQPPKDPYDAKSGIYTIPTYSESQQFAINREQLLGAMGLALGGKKYTTPQYYKLLSMARSGAFGAPGTPEFIIKLQAALASLAAAQAANNTVTGGTGNDTTTGGTGNDTTTGGTGNDTVNVTG